MESECDGKAADLVLASVSNRNVEEFLGRIEPLPDAHVSFYPMGVLALKPPPSEAADQVTDVQTLSPIEVFLAGHQSVGSWRGFLAYAAASGAVVWVGLHIGSIYLLIAAMLVAPFAGPAMNAAIATASGEWILLRRSLIRYVAALSVTIAITYVLTLLLGPDTPSARMIEESQVSSIAVIIPLVGGAAGALYLLTSERNSLISGAAVGLLVAAALAPPAGVVGMAAALGRWDMAGNAAFVLVLQLVGIHLAGALVFRLFGLTHQGARREAGGRLLFPIGMAVTSALLAVLLAFQFRQPVNLNRTTLAQKIASAIETEISYTAVRAEYVSASFMQTPPERPPVLVAEILMREPSDLNVSTDSLSQVLSRSIHGHISHEWPEISPVLDIRWVTGP